MDFTLDALTIEPGTLYALILITNREEPDHREIHEQNEGKSQIAEPEALH